MRLLILDNYDSFTYNLVHLVENNSDVDIDVRKNDAIGLEEVENYDRILLSPGPGLPSQAGIMPELLRRYHQKKPILGVCLGLQAIGELYGSPLKNLDTVYHGIATPVKVIGDDHIFRNCPAVFNAGRYHSWVIDETRVDPSLEVTAIDESGLIMALKHRTYNVRGVQFHPESILSEFGDSIISNWLHYN